MNADYGKWEVLLFQFYDSPIKSFGSVLNRVGNP